MKESEITPGIDIILKAREKQIELGYTSEHDDVYHISGELARLSSLYAMPPKYRTYDSEGIPLGFPFEKKHWKPTDDRVKELAKAGALIVAEIERYQRKEIEDALRFDFGRLMQFYFRLNYGNLVYNDGSVDNIIHKEEFEWRDNNTFKAVVTEGTVNNGYNSDSKQVKEILEIGVVYTVIDLSVSQSSSTVRLVEFPDKSFNTVNFKIYIDNDE